MKSMIFEEINIGRFCISFGRTSDYQSYMKNLNYMFSRNLFV